MKTLRNTLFALLISPFVFYSAQAGEMTLTGDMEVAHTKQDGETGNPIGLENEMTISASTELDNGFSVGYKMTVDANALTMKSYLSELITVRSHLHLLVRHWMQTTTLHQLLLKKQNTLQAQVILILQR